MPTRTPYLPCIKEGKDTDGNNKNILTFCLCKPQIRKNCKVGDYIVGIGSASAGEIQGKVLWIFRVDEKMTFEEYNIFCTTSNKNRIPNNKLDNKNKYGDCIYFKDKKEYKQRDNDFHCCTNIDFDIGGKFCLISYNYIFFDQPIDLPNNFKNKKGDIVDLTNISFHHQEIKRGHRSQSNNQYEKYFMEWLLISCNNFNWNTKPNFYPNKRMKC